MNRYTQLLVSLLIFSLSCPFTPALADGGTGAAPLWLFATNQQGQTRVTHTFVLTEPHDTLLVGSGQIVIDFDTTIDITDVNPATSVFVDWLNDEGVVAATTGTITKNAAARSFTIPFTMPGSTDSYRRAPIVEIREIRNPTVPDPPANVEAIVDIQWQHSDGSLHTNLTDVKEVFGATDTSSGTYLQKRIDYELNGDGSLTYVLAPEEGVDTQQVTINVTTNATTYDLRLYRDSAWTLTGLDGATPSRQESLPLDGSAAEAWGGVNYTTAATFDANEKGFGVMIDRTANNANTLGPDTTTGNYYELMTTTDTTSRIMYRDTGATQWTDRAVADSVTLEFGARANWSTEAGRYKINVTFNLSPSY